MNFKSTTLVFVLAALFVITSCSAELESENAQLKKEMTELQAQLKEQVKLSDFAKEQATTAKRRADEAEKALADCNNSK